MNNKIQELIFQSMKDSGLDRKIDDLYSMIEIERPKESSHGHFSTNLAMKLPRYLKKPPREIAETIVENIPDRPDLIDKVEIKGPGFINFFI